jgi:membrane-associated protein
VELLKDGLDLFLHLDRHLAEITRAYGGWTYAILFLIVFCETGLVVTPFLPGDSLLFAAGGIATLGGLSPALLCVLLALAAILGDTVNYHVGRFIGPRAFSGKLRFLKQEHLERTRAFYARHGAKTIVLARFVPIIRTFAPFVAGVGIMDYRRFLAYNVAGGVLWVVLFVYAGYLFGNIPAVQQNFTLVILAIIALSVLPIAIEIVRGQRQAGGTNSPTDGP